jgi:hypothetical protein
MKAKYILSSLAGMALLMAACTPDDHDLAQKDFTSTDLVDGVAYTVTCDENNHITMQSLLDKKYQCFWIQPNGYSKGSTVEIDLPFAGTYPFVFGVDTKGGVVYGDTTWLTITTNNMSLLEDPLYAYLTGGVGSSKTWVPCDGNYGVGQCTGPVMYCNPDDVLNDGSKSTDIGINHMTPNWDPGFQSWLIPEDSPYMDSYMTFTLSDTEGCKLVEYRGESGSKGASTGVTMTGKYNLNLSDAAHPRLSFTDTYSLHNAAFDEVCANYTTNIYITELTPYFLQLATMRTNSEGPWWIIWNFIAKDVKDGIVTIPSDNPEYLETSDPVLPEIADLATNLFTTDINGVNYLGDEMTFLISEDAPYDWMWWNGATSAWETTVNGNYNASWAPAAGDEIADYELTLTQKGSYTAGELTGSYTLNGSKLTFDQPITILTAASDTRTVAVTGTEFTVFKCDAGSELILGVPAATDQNGNVNSYLVTNMTYKAVGGGETGPVVVPFTAGAENNYIEAGNYFRCQLYNPWGGGGDMVDPSNIKIKKNQTIKVNITLKGFTFSQTAKMVLCCNRGGEQSWEPDCFSYTRAIEVNSDGTYTLSWTNDTGSTVKWDDGTSALIITMQYSGYAEVAADEDGSYKSACTVNSITIE